MKEFAEELQAEMPFIADGSGDFTRALDAGVDLSEHGLGYRTRRFTAVIEGGKVVSVNDENGPGFTITSKADTVLASL